MWTLHSILPAEFPDDAKAGRRPNAFVVVGGTGDAAISVVVGRAPSGPARSRTLGLAHVAAVLTRIPISSSIAESPPDAEDRVPGILGTSRALRGVTARSARAVFAQGTEAAGAGTATGARAARGPLQARGVFGGRGVSCTSPAVSASSGQKPSAGVVVSSCCSLSRIWLWRTGRRDLPGGGVAGDCMTFIGESADARLTSPFDGRE